MTPSFEGKRVLVTGAARGIGFAAAEEFARAGGELVISDIRREAIDHAAERLRAHGRPVHAFAVDVSRKDDVDAMASAVLERLGGLDILVNNAGIGHCGQLETTSLEDWQRLMNINFWGPLYHVYAFLPAMKAQRSGHIVNVSSGQAFFRLPTWGAYAITKLALGAFSELLHFELDRHGVAVTTVYPYMVNTGFYDRIEVAQTLAARMSMRLLPYYSDTPEKVAKLIVSAVRKRKRVEMVSVVNDIGYYSRLIPHVSGAVSRVTHWLLAGDAEAPGRNRVNGGS